MDIAEIIERLGGVTAAAERLGQKRTTVAMWKNVGRLPLRHVPSVSRALGVPAEVLWPELNPPTQRKAA